jgi:hypothetical protein
MTIRYERDHSSDPSLTGYLTLTIIHKIPGDDGGRSMTPLCFLRPVGDGTFGCLDTESQGVPFTRVPVGTEATVHLSDYTILLPRTVGSRIWINGQLVTGVQVAGEYESGHFLFPPFRTAFR